jgi:hypothetical protein
MVAVLATLLPCVGCWEEVHYEPPAKSAAPDVAPKEGTASAAPSDTSADGTSGVPAPSGDDLFAGDPPLANDPGAEAPVAVDPPAPAPIDDPTPPQAVVAPTAGERRAAWTLASDWSLVAAMQAKGLGPNRYESFLTAAREAGNSLGVPAPTFPKAADPAKLEAAIVADLQIGAGPKLVGAIASRLGDAAGATARLAIRAHMLLLTYTPAGSTVWGDAADIRDAGVASGLPPELWRPLVEQLERRADYLDVRKAVFALRDGVSAHLAE